MCSAEYYSNYIYDMHEYTSSITWTYCLWSDHTKAKQMYTSMSQQHTATWNQWCFIRRQMGKCHSKANIMQMRLCLKTTWMEIDSFPWSELDRNGGCFVRHCKLLHLELVSFDTIVYVCHFYCVLVFSYGRLHSTADTTLCSNQIW